MSPTRRYRSLDGLRGLGAVIVVAYHLLLVVPSVAAVYTIGPARGVGPESGSVEWWLYRTPLRVFWAGHEAVLLFFVLSGVVLTLPLIARSGRGWSWAAYYARRLSRLYLPVWGALVIALTLATVFVRDTSFGSSWMQAHKPPTVSAVANDFVLLFNTSNLNSPLWSLRWEIWFSLLLPVMFWMVRLLKATRWWLAAIPLLAMISAVSAIPILRTALPVSWMTSGLLEYLPVFAIGMIIAHRLEDFATYAAAINRQRWSRSIWGALGLSAVGLALSTTYPWPTADNYVAPTLTRFASLIGIALIIFLAQEARGFARVLESRPFQWMGSRSFSIYLIHEPIIVALAIWLRADSALPWLALAGPMVILVLGVAELFYRGVEHPSHRLSQRIGRRVKGERRSRTPDVVHAPGEARN